MAIYWKAIYTNKNSLITPHNTENTQQRDSNDQNVPAYMIATVITIFHTRVMLLKKEKLYI